jgi:hypothetical protein
MIEIRPAELPRELSIVRELFREYADGLGVDLCFKHFDDELAMLPGAYAPPSGRLLVALRDEDPVGSVALRRIDVTSCEMKRLYVRPQRGDGRSSCTVALCARIRSIASWRSSSSRRPAWGGAPHAIRHVPRKKAAAWTGGR